MFFLLSLMFSKLLFSPQIYADIKMHGSDAHIKKLVAGMRLRGEVYRYETDSTSGKMKVKVKQGSNWIIIREKEDLIKFASPETRKEGGF